MKVQGWEGGKKVRPQRERVVSLFCVRGKVVVRSATSTYVGGQAVPVSVNFLLFGLPGKPARTASLQPDITAMGPVTLWRGNVALNSGVTYHQLCG